MPIPRTRAEGLEAVAAAARRFVETIEKGERTTGRSYAGDLGDVERALHWLDETNPHGAPQKPGTQESLFG